MQDQLSIQSLLLQGVSKESEQYRTHVALLEAKRRLGDDLSVEQEQMIRLLEQQSTQIDQQNEFAELIKGIWEGVGTSIQGTFSDTFEDLLRSEITSCSSIFADLLHGYLYQSGGRYRGRIYDRSVVQRHGRVWRDAGRCAWRSWGSWRRWCPPPPNRHVDVGHADFCRASWRPGWWWCSVCWLYPHLWHHIGNIWPPPTWSQTPLTTGGGVMAGLGGFSSGMMLRPDGRQGGGRRSCWWFCRGWCGRPWRRSDGCASRSRSVWL